MPQTTHEETELREAPQGVLGRVALRLSPSHPPHTVPPAEPAQDEERVSGDLVLLTNHRSKYFYTTPGTASTRQNLEHQKKLPIT